MNNTSHFPSSLSDAYEDPMTIAVSLGLITLLSSSFAMIYFGTARKNHPVNAAASGSPWPKVPGAKPIIGNSVGKFRTVVETLEQWADLYGSEHGIYECTLFGRKFFIFCSEDKMVQLDKQRPYGVTRRDNFNESLQSVGGDGLFTAEGEVWKHDRRLVGPFLNRKNVRDNVSVIKRVASRLVSKWDKTVVDGEGTVSVNMDLLLTTMDIISMVGYGEDVNSLGKSGSQITDDVRTLMEGLLYRLVSPIRYWNIPVVGQYLDGLGWARKRLRHSLYQIISEHNSSMTAPKELDPKSSGAAKAVDRPNCQGPMNFLKKMYLQSKHENSTLLSVDRLVGNLLTFFVAGSETTATTLCSALYELAIDTSGLQDEILAEVLKIGNLETEASMEDFSERLPRLRSFMYEVLRLKGPTRVMTFQGKKEFELDGFSFPPNSKFILLWQYASTVGASKNDKSSTCCTPRGLMDAPLTDFCPRRFLVEEYEAETGIKKLSALRPSSKTGFRPFGSSLRVCPGRELAETEILIILSFILKQFEIGLVEGHEPLTFRTQLAQTPGEVRVTLKPRDA